MPFTLSHTRSFADRHCSIGSYSTTSYSYHASYLNKKGAEAYTRALTEDIKSMGILGKSEG